MERINPKDIPIGSVGYFITKNGHKWGISFGIVEEHYSSEICLRMVTTKDVRRINGVPLKDFKTPTRWQKLPNGWTYNTELFKLEWDDDFDVPFDFDDPDSILKAYSDGVLVDSKDYDYCKIEAEIDSKLGWRIVRKYNPHEYHPSWVSINYWQVYPTYGEALAVVTEHDEELKRQADLSDYEWSVEQIKNTLARLPDVNMQKQYLCWILERDKVEDIEIRIRGGENVEWKYWNRKKWQKIQL